MARLLIQTAGFPDPTVELYLGVNSFGRHPDCDFQLDHPTISARHCEIELELDQITVRDCGSTNGTFINGSPITQAVLQANQLLRLGDVELLVENVDVKIAIPKIEVHVPPPPVVLDDGSMLCQRHPKSKVTYRCTWCERVMCDACVRRMRRKGGKVLMLCCMCSHTVQPLNAEAKKKRGFLGILRTTVKMPFFRKDKHD
jgi:hypothetical protein